MNASIEIDELLSHIGFQKPKTFIEMYSWLLLYRKIPIPQSFTDVMLKIGVKLKRIEKFNDKIKSSDFKIKTSQLEQITYYIKQNSTFIECILFNFKSIL